jgi:phosphoglycolate phosphatase
MNVIFDLDGTLVNSAPGIMGALRYVIKKHGIEPHVLLSADLIGPPLRELLIEISGSSEVGDLFLMEQTFKSYYDEAGVFETTRYEGVIQMLEDLKADGHKLFVATNKRENPTNALIKYFKWDQYFVGTYSLDSFEVPLKEKATLLEKIINIHGLLKNETIYIGDRPEDSEAAKKCNLDFMHASWGYGGDVDNLSGTHLIKPNDILFHLKKD